MILQVVLRPLSQMEDFEFSVDISDRDWECFFAECEECNLLPPSLAGVDDSGMSDIDDTGSIFAKTVQKVNLTAGFSEADHPIDGPPDCEGSPVDHYLSKHAVAGMESILSGSEEDIHLQSINIFFERLKNAAEAETLTEPSQVRAGTKREAIREDERCSDGQQASSTTLAENTPKLNALSAKGETAVAETIEPVDTISNIMKTMKKDEPGSNISPEPAGSNSVLKNNKSAHPETKLIITEEACKESTVNEATQWRQSHDSLNIVETTSHTDKAIKVEMFTPLDDVKQDLLTSQFTLGERYINDSWSNLEMVANVEWKEDPNVAESDATSTNKTASHESSPSASVRRKRRRKRRLSVEPAENEHRYERQVLVKPSDSEEEQYEWRRGTGLCVSEDINLFHFKEPQKHVMSSLTAYSTTSNLPVKISAKEIKVNDLCHYCPPCESQYQYSPESIIRQARYKATDSAENNTTNDRPVTPLRQTVVLASYNSGNVSTHFQPCCKLQVEESSGLNKYPGLPVSITDCNTGVNGKSDLTTETAKCGRKDAHVGSLQQSNIMINSIICFENEQLCTAEVKSLTHSILPSTESNDPTVEISQNDKLSAAKSVLPEDAGNSGKHHDTLCQREAEPQQQLEIGSHDIDHCRSTPKKTHFPLSEVCMSSSDTHNTKPKQFNARACSFLEIPPQVECAKSILDTPKSLPDKCCPSKSPSESLDINIPVQQTEHPVVLHTLSKLDVFSENNTTAERTELPASQIMAFHSGNLFLSGEFNLISKSQRETKLSKSEDLLTCPADITPVSSCCTLDTESVMSHSNENITEMSDSSCISVSQNDSRCPGEKTSLAKQEEGDGPKTQSVSNDDSKCDFVLEAEDAVTASKAEGEPEKLPDSKHSVFAMSSFWSEMEKLTINDILGLRMISKPAPHSYLPPLQESEQTDEFTLMDSGLFTQLDESKPEQTNDDTSSGPNSVESSSASVSSKGVMWERDPVPVSLSADVYTDNMLLTSVNDISQPVVPGSDQTGLRKICKNVSVQNLHALESHTWKGQTLQTLHEGELEKEEHFTDGLISKNDKEVDCSASSATDTYSISLSGIFQYLFGRKQPHPSQSATDSITTSYTDGNSVPETYDHFFSEFDTESFFYPLIAAEDQVKDELVPVFSYSRSANRNLQFPEAYDYFFASSSSDESSEESDEEDYCGPVRVVSRFHRTSSASKISTDIYDNFFSDRDLRQNFFWKNTFSFRNISFTGSTVKQQTVSNSLVPVRPSGRSLRRTVHPINALGNQNVMFSDPFLYSLEDRFSRQLAQQHLRYEDLQMTVPNPSKSNFTQ